MGRAAFAGVVEGVGSPFVIRRRSPPPVRHKAY
jgi:hypothetical protein